MKPNLSLSELLGWDGASPLRADLHCHSTISDGSFTSAELLAQAQAAGLTHRSEEHTSELQSHA